MTAKYEIHLDGVHAGDLSLVLLRDLADLIVEGTVRATRLAAEGRSTSRGSTPAWLAEAAEVRLVGFREGSLALDVAARPLPEVAPQIFPVGADLTGVDLLLDAVDDALQGRRDSDRLDAGMLQVLIKARPLFGRGPSELRITRLGGRSIAFDDHAVERFQRLADATPEPQVDRLVGMLDSLTISTRTCQILVADGSSVRGNLSTCANLEEIRAMLGRDVRIEGTITFKPSGRPQRVEVDHIVVATAHDAMWRRTPNGQLPLERPTVSGTGALASLYGQWPGDEDDDAVFAALREDP